MRLLRNRDVALPGDACIIVEVDTTRIVVLGLALGALPLALLMYVAYVDGVTLQSILLAAFPTVILALALRRLRYPKRPAPEHWRAAIGPDGLFVRLDAPVSEKSVLHLAVEELRGVQRCDRGGIGGGAYLDVHVAPETLASLPARPMIHAPEFAILAHAGHRVSWDRCQLHIALPANPLEKPPEVEKALQALARLGVPILSRRREFWPGGRLGVNAGSEAERVSSQPIAN